MTDGEARIRRLACIRGRVQGVWYRGSTQQEAQRVGVTGWVRNRPDGSVEAALEGPREAVEALL
ncbi:MAG: acylphosphatase, partial [Myxococcota bacterium]